MNYSQFLGLGLIALVDSLNPSAIVMTFVMLGYGSKRVLKALIYILGIFVAYFSIGLALLIAYKLLGSSIKIDLSWIENLINKPPQFAYWVQLVVGILLVIYSFIYRKKVKKSVDLEVDSNNQAKKPQNLIAVFLTGISITFVEASTALPYFGGVSSIVLSSQSWLENLIQLLYYNIIFVFPPLIVTSIYFFNRDRFQIITEKINNFISKYSSLILRLAFLGLGLVLIWDFLKSILG
jgi:cytochrome c biogenesis protein CcdA